ncbi:glycoside hydrolase family 130 protein [Treponema parvum]|uniref:glycoside hydrolase family 130 protein n=1 Tax=Treponema parvum TaxID=138851 RepID=UPI001AEBD401|nr:glycoside hydrolase family 130 protein [Treponema parvum]QTQ16064.1 glycoside hydrolase family 130 protein [Treponema parvum]
MPAMTDYRSSTRINRYLDGKPVLDASMVPYEAQLVFNAGVVKFNGEYVMLFRDDYGYTEGPSQFMGGNKFKGTCLGFARSNDGYEWKCDAEPFWSAEKLSDNEIFRIYDPRLTVIEDRLYLCFAADTYHGLRGGIAEISKNLNSVTIISLSLPDNRNMVLFPEKINDKYYRLERPMPVYSHDGKDCFDIWISNSPDLRYWGESSLLLGLESIRYANDKLGPAAPPVKTDKGWLTLFHAVHKDTLRGKNGWEEKWQKCYMAGIMLLDLQNPQKIIGFSKEPLIVPETHWEVDEGFRTNVIFPGGMILEDNDEVKIYYGASDTVECLATAQLEDLISLCTC